MAADLAQHQSNVAAGHGGRRDNFRVNARLKRSEASGSGAPRRAPLPTTVGLPPAARKSWPKRRTSADHPPDCCRVGRAATTVARGRDTGADIIGGYRSPRLRVGGMARQLSAML